MIENKTDEELEKMWLDEFKSRNLDRDDYSISDVREMLENPKMAHEAISFAREHVSSSLMGLLFEGITQEPSKNYYNSEVRLLVGLLLQFYRYGKNETN